MCSLTSIASCSPTLSEDEVNTVETFPCASVMTSPAGWPSMVSSATLFGRYSLLDSVTPVWASSARLRVSGATVICRSFTRLNSDCRVTTRRAVST